VRKSRVAQLSAIFLAALPLAAMPALSNGANNGTSYAKHEATARNIDNIALQGKRAAIATLLPALQASRNTIDEPRIFLNIIELQQDEAELEFRIVNGKTMQTKSTPDFKPYYAVLKRAVKWCSDFITRFPNDPDASRALYLRAKSAKGIGDTPQAITDFSDYVARYPKAREWRIAVYELGDLLAEQKDFKRSLDYLSRLSTGAVNDTFSTMALDRIAGIYFEQNDIPSGLRYLDIELKAVRGRTTLSEQVNAYQQEKILNTMALYYATALEKKLPGFDVQYSLRYLTAEASRNQLGKVGIHFALLLRTKGLRDDLLLLKSSLIASSVSRADALEVATLVFEYQYEGRAYAALSQTAAELRAIANAARTEGEASEKAHSTDPATMEQNGSRAARLASFHQTVNRGAENLQENFLKQKGDSAAHAIAVPLESLYGLLLESPDTDEATAARIRFNLGEVKYQLKDFQAAVPYYRWVSEHARRVTQPEIRKLADIAALRAIASRYEELRAAELFPKDLKTSRLLDEKSQPIEANITEWIGWIDTYAKKMGSGAPVDAFAFEANRLLYAKGHVKEAIERLRSFVKATPASTFAPPSASLVIDTYVTSENWQGVYEISTDFSTLHGWTDTTFPSKLADLAGQASYKLVEVLYQAKNYEKAQHEGDLFLSRFPHGKFHEDALALLANCALARHDQRLALAYFERLEVERKNTKGSASTIDVSAPARLTAAAIAELDYDFAKASHELQNYLALPESSRSTAGPSVTDARRQAVLLAWISGDHEAVKSALAATQNCGGDPKGECTSFRVFLALTENSENELPANVRGRDPLLTSVIKLKQGALSLKDRLSYLDTIASDWGSIDPLLTYPLAPILSDLIPNSLQQARQQASKSAPLRLDRNRIAKRTELIEAIEKAGGHLAALPWTRVRAGVFSEIAGLYADFYHEFTALPAPAGLDSEGLKTYRASIAEARAPFEKKAAHYYARALAIASDGGIEEEAFQAIYKEASSDNPQLAVPDPSYQPLSGSYGRDEETRRLRGLFAEIPKNAFHSRLDSAIDGRNLPTLIHLAAEAEKTAGLMSKTQLHALHAITEIIAGARAEAWTELATVDVDPEARKQDHASVLLPRIVAFYQTRSHEHSQALAHQVAELGEGKMHEASPSPMEAEAVATANRWSTPTPRTPASAKEASK
jgi:TolA-binding protein